MYRLELVTSRAGLEPLAWRLFPGLVPVTQSEWFNIYAMKSPEPLTDFLRGTLDNWRDDAEIILAWHCEEVSELNEQGAYVTPKGAAEISGHSESTWKTWCQNEEVPGAFKPGDRAWLIPRAYAESKKKER